MSDGHQTMHNGFAPGCPMWTPILPISVPAVPSEGAKKEKVGSRVPISDGLSAGADGAENTAPEA